MKSVSPEKHIKAAKRRLGHLAGLSHKTAEAETRIAEAAHDRLAVVDGDLAKLRPRALLDDEAGEQFEKLTIERGQLQMVIAQSAAVSG